MPDLIVLRLHPREPMEPATFTQLLDKLEITALERSFSSVTPPPPDPELGRAKNLADNHKPSTTNNSVKIGTGAGEACIMQHYIDVPESVPLNLRTRELESVATAVIVVNPPGGGEYPAANSYDVRIEITRNGLGIAHDPLEFNVAVTTVGSLNAAAQKNQKNYFAMEGSAYIELPPADVGLDPNVAWVDLPVDGQPPSFDAVVHAVDLVLTKDPGGGATLRTRSPLTVTQARHIASEIVWNRTAEASPEPSARFGTLYSKPAPDGTSQDNADKARMKFEAELEGYYGTRQAAVLRLAGFVFSASAAIEAERLSKQADRARLDFPVLTVAGAGVTTTISHAAVALRDIGVLTNPFTIPAAYFYALTAMMPPQVDARQRYDLARFSREDRLLKEFEIAIDAGLLTVPVDGVELPAATRRLEALGSALNALVELAPDAGVAALVNDWLGHPGTNETIDVDFWEPATQSGATHEAAYLDLLLTVLSENHAPLIAAVKGGLGVGDVDALVAITDEGWRDLFLGPAPHTGPYQVGLLPPFTEPGTPHERTEAFIRHLRKFFDVSSATVPAPTPGAGAPPALGQASDDVLAAFEAAYNALAPNPLAFGTPLDPGHVRTAAATVFPNDAAAAAWLEQTIRTIAELYDVTDVGVVELQFSLIEALYARGFTSLASVSELSPADFAYALTGTVAYPHADAIHERAGGGPAPDAPRGPFAPVNPDGSLTDCLPPAHLSPLGPVQYLHELLQVAAGSTCASPLRPEDGERLGELLAGRRGALGDLHATRANLETPLPVIDLVNESLESLATNVGAGASGGAVYDTADDNLHGHLLATGREGRGDPFAHDPQTLFAAVPEHSSPATPVAQPGAYDVLGADFSAPNLPYPQALDTCRSYLEELGTSRFATMRHFRRDITEFPLDPPAEPAGFLRHLWRLPARLEIALEYLRISPEEYEQLYSRDIDALGGLVLREVLGFPAEMSDGRPWRSTIVELPELLARVGLEYCEFLELWRSGFVAFKRARHEEGFPECEPCCLEDIVVDFGGDPAEALRRLVVFVRLWRRLQAQPEPRLTFAQLRDVAEVLRLFEGDSINPEFVRQLAAFLMLRDMFCLPMSDPADQPAADATGADRTHLLAVWDGPASAKWEWAMETLVGRLENLADILERGRRGPDWTKVLVANLDPLSVLAGFDPTVPELTWHTQPTSTLRFAEVLWKITISEFTVGEILFLFTADEHLDGDDPFPLQPPNESYDDPFQHPDDDPTYGLWSLRQKLLAVDVDDQEAEAWTWPRIMAALRDDHGLPLGPVGVDRLIDLGQHFFPGVLGREGTPVAADVRRFRVALAAGATAPLMWNTPPGGPFRFDLAANELWTELPLLDRDVTEKLSQIRALTANEQAAVRELYFAPRAMLAPFSFLFWNFDATAERLIHEGDEEERFRTFQREFARFHRRARTVAEHLAGHVAAATGYERAGTANAAWRLLRQLWGDENHGLATWEDDSGEPPDVTWKPQPTGGAVAALLGLAGTGVLGQLAVEGQDPAWREMRGPFSPFGEARNEWNAPVPTVIPSMEVALTAEQQRYVAVRNGFALHDVDGEPLFGGQPFSARWHGALLVELPGEYRFEAGAPTEEGSPDFEAADDKRWLVTLRRGQRRWFLLNHEWVGEEAPAAASDALFLRRGVYEIEVLLDQPEPTFLRPEDICPRHTGFQVKYAGPDTGATLSAIPFDRLFRLSVDEPLDTGVDVVGAAQRFLRDRYTSSLRDIRRTYQRAFKAVLLAHLFELSAEPLGGDPQSELDYLLDHAEQFQGRAYFPTAPHVFAVHGAWFDPNLLPVADPHGPPPAGDQRATPSARRRAALFDWWERLFDYDNLRRETAGARERPAWRLFYEATDRQPDDPAQLLRHLGIDLRHAVAVEAGALPILLTYFDTPAAYTLAFGDLESEPWAIRANQGEKWLRALLARFLPRWIGNAQPALWAADDPGASGGNENLTTFVREGCFENGDPRRYANVQALNDGLRERARRALVAYLSGMDRVGLPYAPGQFAREPRDLSDLLLQDVEAGLCERASRVEEAISAVQAFVQRARLGLEPSLVVTPSFVEVWDGRFASVHTWRCCKQRDVYRENWIEWDELRSSRRVEAFRLMEAELREATLTIAARGGLEWWPPEPVPARPCVELLQERDPSHLRLLALEPLRREPENLDLMGAPEEHAAPSWLAPFDRRRSVDRPDNDEPERGDEPTGVVVLARGATEPGEAMPTSPASGRSGGDQPSGGQPLAVLAAREAGRLPVGDRSRPSDTEGRLPFWTEAAVRLGARFVRVAAAGTPSAAKRFEPCQHEMPCCEDCEAAQEPLVDEYFFWLLDSRRFDAILQNADVGLSGDEGSDGEESTSLSGWHDPTKLPGLLDWPSLPMVHLCWTCLHNGELQPPRRSPEGVAILQGALPQLDFMGRTGDSLRFEISGAVVPVGHADPTPPGFRYDMASDAAVVLPQVGVPDAAVEKYTGGLPAYPFFAYFCAGAPLEPLSLFSVGLTVAGTLRAGCNFEAALKWYQLVYNPLTRDDAWARCDDRGQEREERVPEEPTDRVPDEPTGEPVRVPSEPADVVSDISPLEHPVLAARALSGTDDRGRRRRGDGDVPCCSQDAPDADVARGRAILLHYVETLLEWSDALVCRNSPEAFRRANVLLDVAGRVLGEHPRTVLASEMPGELSTIAGFEARPAPLNPRLLALYERVADRRRLLRDCDNAWRRRHGRPNLDMPYFGDDPTREGWRCETCGCCDCGDCVACCDAYRFRFRLEKALELTNEVRSLGVQLLAAYEKRDAEHLAALHSVHERQLLELALDVRKNQWRDADWQVQALQKGKEHAQTRLRYYQTLITNGLNAGEIGYQALTAVSMGSRTAGNVSEAIAQGMGIVPDMWIGVAGIAGTPLQFNQLPVGNKLAAGFATAARILNALAEIASSGAGLSLTQGGWDRREDEWRHQVEIIGIEIEQIERQILGAERRRDIALRELNNHQRQIENTIELQDFLRDKFTNQELYLWLQRETSALYYQTYELAHEAARQAERSFNYERGYTSRKFLPEVAWDSLHDGLNAGDRIHLGLRQMEKSYFDEDCREYELTKHVSLRLNAPRQFLALRTTGSTDVDLPEWLFDLDYPGHYMRRIKNVALSIPAVVGPYTGVHCRLTLLSSTTRVDPRLRVPAVECCREPCDCEPGNSCCTCPPSPKGYAPVPEDPRIVRAYAATEAIATSSGQNDSGMFELSFRDERYLPFEFAGAVSRWRIELPPETNFFDFDALSDVVLHINYTAREGGEALRAAAAADARSRLPGDGLRLFDVRRDLPDAWHELGQRVVDRHHGGFARRLPLRLNDRMFPFVPERRVRWIDSLQLMFEAPGAELSTNHMLRFFPGEHRHDHDEHCECDRDDFACVASGELPGLFWGGIDLRGRRLGPLGTDHQADLGTIEFPDEVGDICDVHLVVRYCADPWPRCGEPLQVRPCDAGPMEPGQSDRKWYADAGR